MLEKVFNMYVDIPENVAINIPGLRNPSSLPHLKKVRQKIRNKLKLAKKQLQNQQKISQKHEISLISNNSSLISQKELSYINKIPKNILDDNVMHQSYYKTSLNKNNETQLCNLESFSNLKPTINECDQPNYANLSCHNVEYSKKKLFDINGVNEIQNDENKTNEMLKIQSSPSNIIFPTIPSRLKKSTCTITSLNINSEENFKSGYYEKSDYNSNVSDEASTSSSQNMNTSKLYIIM